jgi:hypothetical protein
VSSWLLVLETPGLFFRWATPLMARQVHKNIAADLERLRACLEN